MLILIFFARVDDTKLAPGKGFFRRMVTSHACLILLSDVYLVVNYAHDRNSGGLLQDMAELNAADMVQTLGGLYRICIWKIKYK